MQKISKLFKNVEEARAKLGAGNVKIAEHVSNKSSVGRCLLGLRELGERTKDVSNSYGTEGTLNFQATTSEAFKVNNEGVFVSGPVSDAIQADLQRKNDKCKTKLNKISKDFESLTEKNKTEMNKLKKIVDKHGDAQDRKSFENFGNSVECLFKGFEEKKEGLSKEIDENNEAKAKVIEEHLQKNLVNGKNKNFVVAEKGSPGSKDFYLFFDDTDKERKVRNDEKNQFLLRKLASGVKAHSISNNKFILSGRGGEVVETINEGKSYYISQVPQKAVEISVDAENGLSIKLI